MASTVVYAEYLQKLGKYADYKLIPVTAGEANKETVFAFEKADVQVPKALEAYDIHSDDKFILVDHNELAQLHDLVLQDNIMEIVDHHKVNMNFSHLLHINIKPLGSTCTIIYQEFKTAGIEPSDGVAKLMLLAILSDTQGLKSKLTTELDTKFAEEIADKLAFDMDEITIELFKAKSDITGLSAMQIATKDYKIFEFGDKKVFINQAETVEPQKVVDLKAELVSALKEIKTKFKADQTYLVVTDIINLTSQVIYDTEAEKEIAEKAFETVGQDNIADIGARTSRKKDIAPFIEKALI